MSRFVTTLKAIGRSGLLGNFGGRSLIQPRVGANCKLGEIGYFVTVRWLSSISGIDCYSSSTSQLNRNYNCNYINNNKNKNVLGLEKFQRRWFLGCGDGEEGSALSKIHEERLVIGYSPEQIYAVVAAVDLYEDFLPWCQRSDILRRYPDGSFDAELEIGFKFLIESYVSHVVLDKAKMIKVQLVDRLSMFRFYPRYFVHGQLPLSDCDLKQTTASESNLFEHLINVWEFSPGPTPETCSVYFLVDFKFRSPLYRQVASMFFKEVVSRLVSSFIDRCRLIYGPGATIQQKA